MGSKIIGDEPCPQCRENGGDSTGNHLILFSNGNKYCNRCNYKEIVKTSKKEEIAPSSPMSIKDIQLLSSSELVDRKLSEITCMMFGM